MTPHRFVRGRWMDRGGMHTRLCQSNEIPALQGVGNRLSLDLRGGLPSQLLAGACDLLADANVLESPVCCEGSPYHLPSTHLLPHSSPLCHTSERFFFPQSRQGRPDKAFPCSLPFLSSVLFVCAGAHERSPSLFPRHSFTLLPPTMLACTMICMPMPILPSQLRRIFGGSSQVRVAWLLLHLFLHLVIRFRVRHAGTHGRHVTTFDHLRLHADAAGCFGGAPGVTIRSVWRWGGCAPQNLRGCAGPDLHCTCKSMDGGRKNTTSVGSHARPLCLSRLRMMSVSRSSRSSLLRLL